jgi:hypothetical protein
MFNGPAAILAARVLAQPQRRPTPLDPPRRAVVHPEPPQPLRAPAGEKPRPRRHGRARIAWR